MSKARDRRVRVIRLQALAVLLLGCPAVAVIAFAFSTLSLVS